MSLRIVKIYSLSWMCCYHDYNHVKLFSIERHPPFGWGGGAKAYVKLHETVSWDSLSEALTEVHDCTIAPWEVILEM